MSEPWMSVHAPESWPVGGDQFMTFSMPQHVPAAPFVNTPQTTIQWSQSWDVPSSQKGFGGMMNKSSMKSKGQTIEGFSAGLAKLSVREEPKPVEVPIVVPAPQPDPEPEDEEEDEQEDPDTEEGKEGEQKKQQQQQQQTDEKGHPNIEDELSKQNLYKTELCRSFVETGICRYGHKCQFAHGSHELRPVLRHPKYKTEACKTFSITGQCPYGNRCRFIHQPGQLMNSGSSSLPNHPQSKPIPIGNNGAAEFGWSSSWSNAGAVGTTSPPITSPAFAPASASSNFSGNIVSSNIAPTTSGSVKSASSVSPSSTPSPGSSPNKSRDDNPRRLAFFQGLAN